MPLRDYVPLDPPLAREDFLESPAGAAELQKVHQQYRGRGHWQPLLPILAFKQAG